MTVEPDSAKDHCPARASDRKADEQHSDLNEKASTKTTPGTESVQERLANLGGKAPDMSDIPRDRDAGD